MDENSIFALLKSCLSSRDVKNIMKTLFEITEKHVLIFSLSLCGLSLFFQGDSNLNRMLHSILFISGVIFFIVVVSSLSFKSIWEDILNRHDYVRQSIYVVFVGIFIFAYYDAVYNSNAFTSSHNKTPVDVLYFFLYGLPVVVGAIVGRWSKYFFDIFSFVAASLLSLIYASILLYIPKVIDSYIRKIRERIFLNE